MPGSVASPDAPTRPVWPRRTWLGALLATACAARLDPRANLEAPPLAGRLRVLTLNTAHGRGRSPIQGFVRTEAWYRRNLAVLAALLRREQPHVVALQEAELGSTWAGNFDHVAALAQAAGFAYHVATPHVRVPERRCYGTAILSCLPMLGFHGHTFEHGRWAKGFSAAQVDTPEGGPVLVGSVHLDHASPSTRREQMRELIAWAQTQPHPQIWMGDFNDTGHRDGAIMDLRREGSLKPVTLPFRPTHPGTHRTLDWIFASTILPVTSARVLADRVSDHRAVVAEFATPEEKKRAPRSTL